MMKTLDRYIVKNFLVGYVIALLVLSPYDFLLYPDVWTLEKRSRVAGDIVNELG